MERVILHSDMNNFYASVECMLNPELNAYPIAVCGDVEERHGTPMPLQKIQNGVLQGYTRMRALPELKQISAPIFKK